jgi:hypothetical protein
LVWSVMWSRAFLFRGVCYFENKIYSIGYQNSA